MGTLAGLVVAFGFAVNGLAQETKKPNILVIWGDDIGYWNVSAYNQGMTGYKTPNIDSIAKQGALFTDWYGQQSCTAGRAKVKIVMFVRSRLGWTRQLSRFSQFATSLTLFHRCGEIATKLPDSRK